MMNIMGSVLWTLRNLHIGDQLESHAIIYFREDIADSRQAKRIWDNVISISTQKMMNQGLVY